MGRRIAGLQDRTAERKSGNATGALVGMPHLPSTSIPYERGADIPLDDDAKRAVALAAEEADLDRQYWIDSDHLLRGLLRFSNNAAEAMSKANFGSPIDRLTRSDWELKAWESIVDGYFSLQNNSLFELFQTEIVSVQSALLILGAPFFDPRPLQMLSGVFRAHRVAVFLNLGEEKAGFVAPGGTGPLLINLGGMNERIPSVVKDLKESYAFEQFDDSPLHQSIKVFADFVARGRRHEIDGHLSEALLHYVIALELIFGERQAIQRSVSERVAIITHRQNGRSFTQQQEWIDAIYDLRSRYVHEGKEVTDEPKLQRLRVLCEQVFRSLLRLQAAHPDRSSRGKETMTKWLHEVDYLAKGLIAGKQPTESQLNDAFVG